SAPNGRFASDALTFCPLTRNDQRATTNGIAGSTAVVANASGAKVGEVRYKAWGEERPACGSPPCGTIPTTYRYTGQRWESGIGLYFYNARWYDPALGRFVQPDTVQPDPGDPQQLSRFSYARNNPLRFADPTGHWLAEEAGNPRFNPANVVKPAYPPSFYFPIRVPWHEGDVGYGEKYSSPPHLAGKIHPGVDLIPDNPDADIPVYAIAAGKVVRNDYFVHKEGESGAGQGYGYYLVIEHSLESGEKAYSLYAHLAGKPSLEVGSEVKAGECIGMMGSTGTGVKHLHLEIRKEAGYNPWRLFGEITDDNINIYFYNPLQLLQERGVNTGARRTDL
ncbi:MAG: RHS repeat-associated core domain-containing protein, partial [Candidatus Micrarchaeaceae archaeon]